MAKTKKNPPHHKGYRRFHMEESQWLGWKDKNLISQGEETHILKNGTVKMGFLKKDLTWTEFR